MTKKELYKKTIEYFSLHNPDAETELNYSNDFELLVAVVLSAQCTDKRVNMVTPNLFSKYPSAEAMSNASVDDIFDIIKSISYPKSKSEHLSKTSKILNEKYLGKVPDTMDELIELPGVGRKTANVLLSILFDKPAIAVDTHVFRVSERIGLTKNAKTVLEAEKQLVKGFPQNLLAKAHHWLILHGRYICMARKPKCEECGITDFCQYYKNNNI